MSEQDQDRPSSTSDESPLTFKVYQSKSPLFRVIHADGVWCSVNAYKNFNVTFFNERHPIPEKLYFTLDDKNNAVENVHAREGKDGWFREMEVNVVLSLHAARVLRSTLDHYIGLTEKQIEEEQKSTKEL